MTRAGTVNPWAAARSVTEQLAKERDAERARADALAGELATLREAAEIADAECERHEPGLRMLRRVLAETRTAAEAHDARVRREALIDGAEHLSATAIQRWARAACANAAAADHERRVELIYEQAAVDLRDLASRERGQ